MIQSNSLAKSGARIVPLKPTVMRLSLLLASCSALLFCLPAGSAQLLSGIRVLNVSDGDTLLIETADKLKLKVRLSGIDAPESRQPFGGESRRRLAYLLAGREIAVYCMTTDRYARQVCRVYADGEDVSLSMLHTGAAWWFRRYAHQQSAEERREYAAAEQSARTHAVGLWEAAEPVAPWNWRKKANH